MPHPIWGKPVRVTLRSFETETVTGPMEALNLLSERWSDLRGPLYVKARSACRAALDGRGNPEDARRKFEQAVKEAKLHLH